ncbi:MAG TPA: OmpA family protein [Myxococcales bacterium]|nr:OmpA family protein [Myxococcales bacterium]
MKLPLALFIGLAACATSVQPGFVANSEYLQPCLSNMFCGEMPAAVAAAPADPCAPGQVHTPEQCPSLDDDGDLIANADDRCPLEKGVAANFGCPPPPDSDGDGIADADDRCPSVPGAASEQGCPALAKVAPGRIDINERVFFDTGKATIKERSHMLLDAVAEVLNANPHLSPVLIAGHTDNRGSADLNRKLSAARAEAVKAYLIEKNVDASRLQAQGFGPDRPAETNKTANGREQNRRVEFLLAEN